MRGGSSTRSLMLAVFVAGLGMSVFVPVSPLGLLAASVPGLATPRTAEARSRTPGVPPGSGGRSGRSPGRSSPVLAGDPGAG